MITDKAQIIIAMGVYMAAIILIGVLSARKANKNTEHYFLGGRSLGPWVTAMSAEASDMSGWLLMGLPGVAYWCGLADAGWTAIGLAVGTYFNWLIVSKRLRRYSLVSDSITVPEFFSKRFREGNSKAILLIAALFIIVFFSVYTGSCFATCGKLFSTILGFDYLPMMFVGAALVIFYTILGGFLAESTSDFLQAIIMIIALVSVLVLGIFGAGGIDAVKANISTIPGFVEFFGMATPEVAESGKQIVNNGVFSFGEAADYGLLTVISTSSWGLGYFGMPQVLLRFMAIRKTSELKRSRRIATVWVVISLAAAIFIGLIGRAYFSGANVNDILLTATGRENVFIEMSKSLLPPLLAGAVMAGILAAAMSSSDSYLLIAASAIANDVFKGMIKKNASDKTVMLVSRLTLLAVSVFGVCIALDKDSRIFDIVSFAWAGFGATFGPLMLFSLFWKRTNKAGAIAGMLAGGGMVFLWKYVIAGLAPVLNIYELFPAFVFSAIVIVIVSLVTPKPSAEIVADFEKAKAMRGEEDEIVEAQAAAAK